MRKLSCCLLVLLCAPLLSAQTQAWSLRNGLSNPPNCNARNLNVFINRTPASESLVICKADGTWLTIGGSGGGDALTTNPLSQFATTTSAQLAGVISNETGSGLLVFGTSPVFTTPNIGAATGSVTGNAGTATALAANPTNCSAGNYPLGIAANGDVESCTAVSAGGIGGSTGAVDNILLRSDGTGAATLQASSLSLSDVASSIVTLASTAGNAIAVTATPPAATTGSQAGVPLNFTAGNAVDGSSTHTAANGGSIQFFTGTAVNSGFRGQFRIVGPGTAAWPIFCINATFDNQCQDGLWYDSQGTAIARGGLSIVSFAYGAALKSNGQFSISSDSNPLNLATRLSGCGTKCWQFGDPADTASVQDYIISGMVATGTNTAGSKQTYRGGFGTGNAAPGDYEVQTSFPLASGTTGQSGATRFYTRGNPKTLTGGSATPLVTSIAIASNTINGGTLYYTIEANDAPGTNYQSLRGEVDFACTNNAGTVSCSKSTPVEITDVPLTTTLTNTVTFTYGTNTFIPNLNAVSSLTETTLRATFKISLDGGTGTVNP